MNIMEVGSDILEWTWLLFFVMLLSIEASTLNLVTIWFAIGALGAFITTYITNDIYIQWIVFILVTIISLVTTRPLVRKLIGSKGHVKTNLDAVVGQIGIVEIEIGPYDIGRVTVLGKSWAAKGDEAIHVGQKVRILSIEGVKLIVKKERDGK